MMKREETGMDRALLEKVNPIFQTAQMTLFFLAVSGDPDAAMLVRKMGLDRDRMQNSMHSTASPEQVLSDIIMMEIRYRTMGRLAEHSGCTLVDLPCGYTPRALSFAKKGLPYYGLDLPIVIREAAERLSSLIPPEKRSLVRFREADATNYISLEKALADIKGSICITTEGLLMYFSASETGVLCDNIRRILEKKGGCWYLADPESAILHILILRQLVGDRFMEIMTSAKQNIRDKSDVKIGESPLSVTNFADRESGIREAEAFLGQHGLKARRIPVAAYMPEIRSLSNVSPEQAAAIREGMKCCAYWKVTPAGSVPTVDLNTNAKEDFGIRADLHDGTLSFALTGRLDTITAPKLLALFTQIMAEHPAESVMADCRCLDYISSAGLRVFLIIHKGCAGGLALRNVNAAVMKILQQAGVDSVFRFVE